MREVLADPHVARAAMVGEFDHPTEGSFPALRTPLRATGDAPAGVPPLLGADTDAVLGSSWASTDARSPRLRDEGVI